MSALIESLETRKLLSTTPSAGAIASVSVVHANSAAMVEPLSDGATLDLTTLGPISIVARPTSTSVGSVVFSIDGKTIQTEKIAPYDIAGDNAGAPNAWTPTVGSHTLKVTPTSGSGTLGIATTVTFTVVTSPAFPTTISWVNGASSPIVRAEAIGAAVGGKLYVFGGFNNQGSPSTTIPLQHRCDSYDPATNTWTRLKDFPEPFNHSGPAIVGTDLWFVGGYVGNHPGPGTTHVWVYHTTNDSWTRGPDLPVARGADSAALVGNTLYVTGGMDLTRTKEMPSTYALDLSNQKAGWILEADNPNGRNHVAAASLGGYFYEIGGQLGQENAEIAQDEVDRYNPATNTWTKVASLPRVDGHVTGDALVYEGRLIVVGGDLKHDDPQRAIYSYDPSTDKWSTLGLLPAARSTVVTSIINGKLVVTTGNGPSATNTTWIGTLK